MPITQPLIRRMVVLLAVGLAGLTFGAAAQQPGSRLRYAAPAGWQESRDPETQLISLAPPGGGASVTFAASSPFAGTAEQWHTEFLNEVLASMPLVIPQTVPGEQGAFKTSMAVVTAPDGSRPWLCLYTLVNGGQGEAVLFFAAGEQEFMAYLATVNEMIYRVTVGGAPGTTTRAAPPASAPVARANAPAASQPGLGGPPPPVTSSNTPLPRIEFTMAPDFFGGSGPGTYMSMNGDGTITVYAFRPFSGDFAQTFDSTLFRDWIEGRMQERRILQRSAAQPFAVAGATQALVVRFTEEYFGGTPREHLRAAVLAANGVAIIDISVQDASSMQRYTDQITSFFGTVRVTGGTSGAPVAQPQPRAAPSGPPPPITSSNTPLPRIEFTMAQDFFGASGPGTYMSLNGDGTITVYAFRPFAGDFAQTFDATLFRDWIEGRMQERRILQRSAAQAFAVPGATQALVARFTEEYFGGTPREHVRAAILAGNGVALVDISVQDASSMQRYSDQIGSFFGSVRVVGATASVGAAPAPVQSRPAPGAPAQGSVAGLYIAAKNQFQPNPFGGVGSGTWVVGTESYLLSANGYAYRTRGLPQAPGGDIARFDFGAAQRSDPANTGTYSVSGNQVIIQLGGGAETIAANRTAPDTLDIYNVAFKRQ